MTDVVDMKGRPTDGPPAEKKVDEMLCKMVEELLREARAGNLVALAFVTGHWDGDTTAGLAGEFNMSMVGEAHVLAHSMSSRMLGLHQHDES